MATAIGVICDVALDPYTSHGHDGLVRDGYVVNDETVDVLCRQAVVQAEAGCDVIAPSDMMDGRVAADSRGARRGRVRSREHHGLRGQVRVGVLRARFATRSARPPTWAAATSGPTRWTRPTRTKRLREVALDIAEGADMVMVKPGMPYLDVVRRVKDAFAVPTFAYQVSGEYAMLCAAAQNGWLDREQGDAGKPAGVQAGGRRRHSHLLRAGSSTTDLSITPYVRVVRLALWERQRGIER